MMKHMLMAAVLMAATALPALASEADPQWATCQSDADCMVLSTGCLVNGVNKASEGPARTHYQKIEQRINCLMPEHPSSLMAVCENAVCVVKEQAADK